MSKNKSRLLIVALGLALAMMASGIELAIAKTSLEVWINDFNPDTKKWIETELIPSFEKENPDIEVTMRFIGWGQHSEQFLTAWASGKVPDVFEPALEQAAEMVATGQTIPLNKYIDASGLDLGDFFPVGYEPYTIDGKLYTIPFRLDIRTINWRKDIFAEVGLDPNVPPDTWEDLRDYALKLNIREGKRLVRQGFNVNPDAQLYMEFLWQNGGEALTEDDDQAIFNSPEGVEALQFLVDLYNDLLPPGTAQLPQTPIPYFATGQQPLKYGSAGDYRDVMRYAPEHIEDVGIAPPLKKAKRVNNVFGGGFAISSVSQHPDEGWKFIEFFTRQENIIKFCQLCGTMPSRKSAVESPYFRDNPPLVSALDAAQYGKVYVVIPEWWMLASKLQDEIELAFNNKKTALEALNDAARTWNEVLAR